MNQPKTKTTEPIKSKAKPRARFSRDRLTLRFLFSTIVIIAVLAAAGITIFLAHETLYENKRRDVWAIFFLELERQAKDIGEKLGPSGQPTAIYRVEKDSKLYLVRGEQGKSATKLLALEECQAKSFNDLAPWNVLRCRQNLYLVQTLDRGKTSPMLANLGVKESGNFLIFWPSTDRIRMRSASVAVMQSIIYMVTREGMLLHSNFPEVTQENFQKRDLVQKFIVLPLWQGQLEYTRSDGEKVYGFFHEVPQTNIVLFAETLTAYAMADVDRVAGRLLMTLGIVLAVVIVLIQLPLTQLGRPISELVAIAAELSHGKFNVTPRRSGFGEVAKLASAFRTMALRLKERDDAMRALLAEQLERARLVTELDLAKRIQDSLLPQIAMPISSGLRVAAQYMPAAEVAGDWYGYFYDEKKQEAIFAIVDISGHGAGASMFTAITASLFEEMRVFSGQSMMSPADFAKNLNGQLLRFGRNEWHASMQIIIYSVAKKEISILNAGHPSPLLVSPDKVRFLACASPVLGLAETVSLNQKTVPFGFQDTLILYTDGLVERRSPQGQSFGGRRLAKTAQQKAGAGPNEILQDLMDTWQSHGAEAKAEDDLCILALQSVA